MYVDLYRTQSEQERGDAVVRSWLERIAASVDHARQEQRAKVRVVNSRRIIPLPTPFKCHLCGCEKEVHLKQYGLRMCAWCGGNGRTVNQRG